MVSFHLRKQQIVYGTALLLGALGCVAAGVVKRFYDIAFDNALQTEYNQFSNVSTILLETSVAFVIFQAVYLIIDLLRSKPPTIWIELVWTFVFGLVEIINVVVLAHNYPAGHCSPSSSSALSKRDKPEDSIMGSNTNADPAAVRMKASREICGNWAAMCVLFIMVASLLFFHWSWLAIVGLRHRVSHPDFFWFGEVPVPLTWNLAPASPSEVAPTGDDAASISTSSSFDEKKPQTTTVSPATPIAITLPPVARSAEVDRRIC